MLWKSLQSSTLIWLKSQFNNVFSRKWTRLKYWFFFSYNTKYWKNITLGKIDAGGDAKLQLHFLGLIHFCFFSYQRNISKYNLTSSRLWEKTKMYKPMKNLGKSCTKLPQGDFQEETTVSEWWKTTT